MSVRKVEVWVTEETMADLKRRDQLISRPDPGMTLAEYNQQLERVNFDLACVFAGQVRYTAQSEGWEL